MAELQTISAVFDLLKLAVAAGVFLHKVKNADSVASEVCDRVSRLRSVLEGIRAILQLRLQHGARPSSTSESVEGRICESVLACHSLLKELQSRVRGFDLATGSTSTVLARFKLAFSQTSIARRQTDLEARISTLQIELTVLQLHDQANGQATAGTNHSELLLGLSQLGVQIGKGHKLLQRMVQEQSRPILSSSVEQGRDNAIEGSDGTAASQLEDCLHLAEDVQERYTSSYAPDDRSIRGRIDEQLERLTIAPRDLASLQPSSREPSIRLSLGVADEAVYDDEEDIWPLEILEMHIAAYREMAEREKLAGHFHQAELNLCHAIRYSRVREEFYNIPFTEKLQLEEALAFLYQKQRKFAEAVGKVRQLLLESTVVSLEPEQRPGAELAQARLHQLLSSIYFDRYSNAQGPALSNAVDDIENAEKHARRAFNKRFKVLKLPGISSEDIGRHDGCIELLVQILNDRGKNVEASQLSRLGLGSDSSSVVSENNPRESSAPSRTGQEFVLVGDKHDLLVCAIRAGETDQIQALLAFRDIDLERYCKDGKTPLMHAVERADENTVRQLLDPDVGANVNKSNRRGLTALHLAAQRGDHSMVLCLINHDSEVNAKDSRGQTPLVKAVKDGHETVIRLLSDRGADMSTRDGEEWSVLHHAAHQPNASIARIVLEIEPSLRDAVDPAGMTALHHCAELELPEHVKILLEHRHKLDVNAVDSRSRSPLYFAATKPSTAKRESMVRVLLKNGAKVDTSRLPPRFREYESLRPLRSRGDDRTLSRCDSVSTQTSSGTAGTTATRLSTLFASRMRSK